MEVITEFKVSKNKETYQQGIENIPEGYRLPTQKELMLMYCFQDEKQLELPKGNVWSSTEYFLKDGTSNSVFAVQFSNGYTATVKKENKSWTMYVKK